jgi:hypothetical protein
VLYRKIHYNHEMYGYVTDIRVDVVIHRGIGPGRLKELDTSVEGMDK